MHKPDYRQWMHQPLVWTERIRSRALVWTPGATWFINDPLGHLPHLHSGASEIIYMAAGQMDITVGKGTHRVGPGDLLFMPPDSYQDYELVGRETVCLFVLVVPNLKDARWQYQDFPATAFEVEGSAANVFADTPLPADERITPIVHTLAPGEAKTYPAEDKREKMLYVLDGHAHIAIERLSGEMAPNDYQHVPATHRHTITNSGQGELRYLELICHDPYA